MTAKKVKAANPEGRQDSGRFLCSLNEKDSAFSVVSEMGKKHGYCTIARYKIGGGRPGEFSYWLGRQVKKARPLCGAKTRAGGTCKARCVPGKKRCRMHGGLSTGPTSQAGRQVIIDSNKRRAKTKQGG